MAKEKNDEVYLKKDWSKYVKEICENVRDLNGKVSHIISQLRETSNLLAILDDFRYSNKTAHKDSDYSSSED